MSRRFAKGPRKRRDGRSRLNTPLRRGAHERLMASADVVALRKNISLLIPRTIVGRRILRHFKAVIAIGELQALTYCVSGAPLPIGISDHVTGRTRLFPSYSGGDFNPSRAQPGHLAHLDEDVLLSSEPLRPYFLSKRGRGFWFRFRRGFLDKRNCSLDALPSLECPGGAPSCQLNVE